MILIETTNIFDDWLRKLKDRQAKAKIICRINGLSLGNFGNVKGVGTNLYEIKINEGPGYRIYFTKKGEVLILLLCGGDKSTQSKDIQKAKEMLK